MVPLICPVCRKRLNFDIFGLKSHKVIICTACSAHYKNHHGSIDFTLASQEKTFYSNRYSQSDVSQPKEIDFNKLKMLYMNKVNPERQIFLNELGPMQDKVILLLGNGNSTKELYFLEKNNSIIYSDLSIDAVLNVKYLYDYKD